MISWTTVNIPTSQQWWQIPEASQTSANLSQDHFLLFHMKGDETRPRWRSRLVASTPVESGGFFPMSRELSLAHKEGEESFSQPASKWSPLSIKPCTCWIADSWGHMPKHLCTHNDTHNTSTWPSSSEHGKFQETEYCSGATPSTKGSPHHTPYG